MLNYYQTWKRSLKEGAKLCSVVWASFPIATVDNFDSVCMLDHSLTITNDLVSEIEIALFGQVVV